MKQRRMVYILISCILSCYIYGACGINSPHDYRLSPFWIYFVHLGSTELNAKSPLFMVEDKLTKAYLAASAQCKIAQNQSFLCNDSFEKHEVKVGKMKRLPNAGGEHVTFLVINHEADYISAMDVVQMFSHISYQDMAIVMGVKLLQKPQIFDVEAYDEVDDYLWIIGAVFICVLVAILICWSLILVYLYYIRAEVLQNWVRCPFDKKKLSQKIPATNLITQNELPKVSPSELGQSFSVAYCDATSSVIAETSYQTPDTLAKVQANISNASSGAIHRAHYLSPCEDHLHNLNEHKSQTQNVNKPAVLEISDDEVVPMVLQRENKVKHTLPEPELLQMCPNPVDVSYLRPIIIKQRAHPEAIEIVELTLENTHSNV